MREGGLFIGRDALHRHRQGHLVLAEQDVEARELRKDRVAAGPFEGGGLRLKQIDGFLGLAAFEERAGLEEQAVGQRIQTAGIDDIDCVGVFADPVERGGGRQGERVAHVDRHVFRELNQLQALIDDFLVALPGLEELEIALKVFLGEGVVDRQEFQAVFQGLDAIVGSASDIM